MRLALIYFQVISTGGLEKYLLGLARGLAGRGHDLVVVTARTDGAVAALGAELRLLDPGAVPKVFQLRAFARAVDVVLPELGADFTLGFGRTVGQDVHRAGGGCHARYAELLPVHRRLGLKNQIELRLERELYTSGRTRHFVVNSHLVASQLREVYDVPEDLFSVIRTPVDSDHFHPPDQPPASDRPVFLFVSSHHRRKGLDALLAAFAELPDSELWIAGAPLSPRYRLKIQHYGLAERVRSVGEVADLAPIYRAADFFVHPTLYDACANTVLQAMASGLPSLVSVRDGASEFIEPGVTGLRLDAPDDPAALHASLNAALRLTSAERHAIGTAARACVLPLTWDAHVDQWLALLDRLGPAAPFRGDKK